MEALHSSDEKHIKLQRQIDERIEIFKRFVETSGQALGMADLDGRIIFVNSIFCRMAGVKQPEDLYDQDLYICYPPETARRLRDEILPLVRQEGRWVGELTLIDREGHITPVIENIFLLADDDKPLCFATVCTDITQRIRMEEELLAYRDNLELLVSMRTEELKKSNALLSAQIVERNQIEKELFRLKAILENTSDFVGASTPDGFGLYMNAAGRRMVGFGPDEDLSGRNLSEVHPAWAWRIVEKTGIPAAIAKGVWEGETALQNLEGKEIPVSQVIIVHHQPNGTIEYISTIIRDISERKQAEDALRASEEKFAAAFHSSPSAIGITALDDGRFIDVNDCFLSELGYEREEIIGRPASELNLWADPSERESFLRELSTAGVVRNREFQFRDKAGNIHWALTSSVSIAIGGKPCILTQSLDITDRKQAEKSLRDSEEQFRTFAESMSSLVWIADEHGRSIYQNPRFSEYAGLNDCTMQDLVQFIHPEDRLYLEKRWRDTLSSAERVFQCTFRLRRVDGAYRWFLARAILMRDSNHRLVRLYGTASDIDNLKQTEHALEENLEILAEAERIGKTGTWKWDLVEKHYVWSVGMCRIMGVAENEELSFEKIKSIIHPQDLEDISKKLGETIETGKPRSAEFRVVLSDGSIRHVAGRVEASLDSRGRPVVLRGMVQDITERKKLEDEMIKIQRLDSIGTLAGGLAHDYNNLLSVIIGNMELAKMYVEDNANAYTPLVKAEEAVIAARDLTSHLITFSRGGYPVSKIVPARDFLIQAVNLALGGSDTKVEWNVADDLPEVKVDENQIRQVIHNIVINALEAMPEGGKLHVEADKAFLGPDNALCLAEGIYLRLVFRDEGSGIPEVQIPRVFDPYFTTKELGNKKGMGLGLSISYSIIKRHEGYIRVDSKEGTGTTVTIFIPAS